MSTITLRQREKKQENNAVVKKGQTIDPTNIMREVDESLVADKVIGAYRDANFELHIVVKWKNKEGRDLVPSTIANVRWPQLVIRYYEQRIRWIKV